MTSLNTDTAAYAALVLAALSSGLSTATTKCALASFSATDLLVVELAVTTLLLWLPRGTRRRLNLIPVFGVAASVLLLS